MTTPADPASAALRTFAILDVIIRANSPISLTRIVNAVALPKPTVYRILGTLESAGWVLREPGERNYTAGSTLARFGLDIVMNNTVRSVRRAILARAAAQIGETCNLTMLDGNQILYVDRIETTWPLKVDFQPGTHVPLHCSASGKLFLSMLSPARRRLLLGKAPLTRYTAHTITDSALLETELDRIQASEIGLNSEEYLTGLVGAAVPIRDHSGQMVMALAIQVPTARLTVEHVLQHITTMRAAALEITLTFDDEAVRGVE